jgi:hypothetical protein
MKAAFSGESSGAFCSQSRTVIASVPKWIDVPIGASIREVRAEILSSPWSTAIGSGTILAEAACAVATPSAAAKRSLIYDRGSRDL